MGKIPKPFSTRMKYIKLTAKETYLEINIEDNCLFNLPYDKLNYTMITTREFPLSGVLACEFSVGSERYMIEWAPNFNTVNYQDRARMVKAISHDVTQYFHKNKDLIENKITMTFEAPNFVEWP